MKYTITWAYCWYDDESTIVKMYFIENIPFTFDNIPKELESSAEVINCANQQKYWSADEMFLKSSYLLLEEAHPLLFDVELVNPEAMPQDFYLNDLIDDEVE